MKDLVQLWEQARIAHHFTATYLQLLTPLLFIVVILLGQRIENRASTLLTEDERRTAEGTITIPFGRWLLLGTLALVLGQDTLRYYAKNQLSLAFAIAAVIIVIGLVFAIYQVWHLGRLSLPRSYVRTMRGVWLATIAILFLMLSDTVYLGWNERHNRITASAQ